MSIEKYLYVLTQTPLPLLFLVCVILCEYVVSFWKGRPFSMKHTLSNFGVLFIGVVAFFLFDHYFLSKKEILEYSTRHALFTTPFSWTSFFIWLVIFDFINYVTHVFYHKNSFFWMFHAVHHSDKNIGASTTLRVPIVASFFTVTSCAFFSIFGLNIIMFSALAQTIFLQQILVHSFLLQKITPSWLSFIFITPDLHILHHTERYNNKNYGFLFSFWDRVFGTGRFSPYNQEILGLESTMDTNNPYIIHKEPLIHFLQDIRK